MSRDVHLVGIPYVDILHKFISDRGLRTSIQKPQLPRCGVVMVFSMHPAVLSSKSVGIV
jgi:hypothetical protein